MATAGYLTTISVSGTSTAMTAEAMTGSGAGPYQITNSAKRVIDYTAAQPTFYDNGVAISASDISAIDYLQGKVTFTASKTGPITVDGSYLPLLTVAEARTVSLSFEADELDTSVFGSQYRTSTQGLKRITGSMEILSLPATDLDPGAGSRSFEAVFNAGTQIVFTVTPGGVTSHRFVGALFGTETGAPIDGLVTTTIPFTSQAVVAADGTQVGVTSF